MQKLALIFVTIVLAIATVASAEPKTDSEGRAPAVDVRAEITKEWISKTLESLAPAARYSKAHAHLAEETPEQRAERYESIADDLHAVVWTEAPAFTGKRARQRTAALLIGIAFHESGFSRDVDLGPCNRSAAGVKWCDSGRSACLMQVNLQPGKKTAEGWTKQDLFDDRRKCFTAALNIARASVRQCVRVLGPDGALAGYAVGTCSQAGMPGSRELLSYYRNAAHRVPWPKGAD